jgi:hypothetical protein
MIRKSPLRYQYCKEQKIERGVVYIGEDIIVRNFVWHAGYENWNDAQGICQQIVQLRNKLNAISSSSTSSSSLNSHQPNISKQYVEVHYDQNSKLATAATHEISTEVEFAESNRSHIEEQLNTLYRKYESITGEEYDMP